MLSNNTILTSLVVYILYGISIEFPTNKINKLYK